MSHPEALKPNMEPDDVYAAAAHWHNRLDEDSSPAARTEFAAWLAADPKHRAAFQSMEQMWAQMGEARIDPRILGLRQEALGAMAQPRSRKFALAAALLATVAGAAFFAVPKLVELRSNDSTLAAGRGTEGGAFRTAIGERSNVTLSDGSTVILNTKSRIEVRFAAERRNVRLLAGQAWFQVAKNPSRPFVVEAGDQRVTALGTAFDVRLGERDSVQVTLAEGRVSVQPIQSTLARLIKPAAKPAELVPGEALVVSEHTPATKHKADVAKVGSWREGQIVFDNDTLATAIAEVNRYSPVQIVLADPALGPLRVSGVFRAGHSESFLETVTGHYPIRIAERSDARIVLKENPQSR